jgi:pRiA4b ORF-3-like protein
MPAQSPAHRLKVTIDGIEPPIWRRLEVPSNTESHRTGVELRQPVRLWRRLAPHGYCPAVDGKLGPPQCLAGKRGCPPEDCGCPGGYSELLANLNDPRHPDHSAMLRWTGGDFDPEAFTLNEVNLHLRRLR